MMLISIEKQFLALEKKPTRQKNPAGLTRFKQYYLKQAIHYK